MKTAMTDESGNYSTPIVIAAALNEPIYWELEAYHPEHQKIVLEGQRIVMREDETAVTVRRAISLPDSEAS